MKYGMSVPNFGEFSDIDLLVETATTAEDAGWDGFFIWDHMLFFEDDSVPLIDPWIALAALACNTTKIKLGPLLTPLPRRRPWKVAREAVSLDHLSSGRLILGAGLGAPPDTEFTAFGEESNARIRAEMLDEGLEILTGLWSGELFSFHGKHYHLSEMTFLPKPYQRRIPIWIGGGVPHIAPFKRAARFDGVAPIHSVWPSRLSTNDLQEVLEIIMSERGNLNNFDVVVSGETSGMDSKEDHRTVSNWMEVGVNWWVEEINTWRASIDVLLERVRAGPPES